MPLTVTLPPALEEPLQQEATREGVTPDQFVTRAVEVQMATARNTPPAILCEADLLLRANNGFSETFWQRFRFLREQLEAEVLTEEERQEFTQLYAQIEDKNATRIAILAQAAQQRGITLPEVM